MKACSMQGNGFKYKGKNLEILYIYFIFVSQWVLFNVDVNLLNFIGIKKYFL
jgi:hypothetical protein